MQWIIGYSPSLTEKDKGKMPKGGKREGAGRKPLPEHLKKVLKTYRATPAEHQWLAEQLRERRRKTNMNTNRPAMPQATVNTLAQEVAAFWKKHKADYQPANENYAPLADLCADVFYNYLNETGQTREDFQRGTVKEIMDAAKPLIEAL